jgi:2-dehydro-3-deoxyphosphooctonate aldolase (KDO 8-P synthase)
MRSMTDEGLRSRRLCAIATPHPVGSADHPLPLGEGRNQGQRLQSASNIIVGQGKATVAFGNKLPFALIAGPCAIESRAHALEMAAALKEIARKLEIGLVFKASFDKANRTAASSGRGLGLKDSLPVFAEIREKLGLPVTTDVHETHHCRLVADVVDLIQIPAFLSRQTDLLVAAAETGKPVNIKKGPFLAPWDMHYAVEKVRAAGNPSVLVTERGASFGYNTLIVDMRALPILAETTGTPVIFDATHSVQEPGARGDVSGGERRFVPVLARAAVAVGIAGLFLETHDDPEQAVSDAANMLPLSEVAELLAELRAYDQITKAQA